MVKKQDLQYCFACGGKDITKNIFRKYFPWNNNKRAFNRFEIKESIKFFLAGIFNNQLINKIRFFNRLQKQLAAEKAIRKKKEEEDDE